VKLLCFLAERFAWRPHEPSLDDAPEAAGGAAEGALVAFVHAEARDQEDPARTLRRCRKQLLWHARKGGVERVVLHSFTHLGGAGADAAWTRGFLEDLAARLGEAGCEVRCTPFGWQNAWELSVRGESLGKVWAEF